MRLPSGANTALLTASGVALRGWRAACRRASHSRAVLSSEAVRMRPPSGANTALTTEPVWPWRVASGLPSRVPQPRGLVVGGGQDRGRRRARTPRS